MQAAWSLHMAGLIRKPPSCKMSLWEISSNTFVKSLMPVYIGRNFEITYSSQILADYTCAPSVM